MGGADVGLKVEGGRQLRRTLKAAGADMNDVRALHREVAATVSAKGRTTAPVRSGRLAATVRPGATQTAAVIRSGKASVPYANPIHWGWHRRHIKAQPWLTTAAQATEPTWFRQYSEGIEKILDQIEGAGNG